MDGLSIKTSDDVHPQELKEAAHSALQNHTAQAGGVPFTDKPFSVLAYKDEKLAGGLLGRIYWNWLYADYVWMEEEFRRRGIGSEIMKVAELRARTMKLTGIYLWTQSWQAPIFYEKLGYDPFVEFKDFPPGHSRLGFLKYLD